MEEEINLDKKVIIIGGGPAGMQAAIAAAEKGKNVILLEHKHKIGLKLGITGKGRCNITNNSSVRNHLDNIIINPKFMISALSKFSPQMLIDFLEQNGLKTKTERGNRIFPKSNQALEVVRFYQKMLKKSGVKIVFAKVVNLQIVNQKIHKVITNKNEYLCDSVVLCTGGLSYPSTGSTGDGYMLAEKCGHRIMPTRPALVELKINHSFLTACNDVHLKNIRLILKKKRKKIFSEVGEIKINGNIMEGPLALTCSSLIKDNYSEYRLILDFKPGLDELKLDRRILRDLEKNPKESVGHALKLLPQFLQNMILENLNIPKQKKANQINKKERKRLLHFLKECDFEITGLGDYSRAVVTRGGVDVREIDSSTMRSKIINNLYFAGEIIDVDALTGGYNLQIAFSTGFVAGNNC